MTTENEQPKSAEEILDFENHKYHPEHGIRYVAWNAAIRSMHRFATLRESSAQQRFKEYISLWEPVDEYVRSHPSVKIGDSVSGKALELLKTLDSAQQRIKELEEQLEAAESVMATQRAFYDSIRGRDIVADLSKEMSMNEALEKYQSLKKR